MNDSLSGRAQTVLGPIDPELLGVTLIHEHLLHDASGMFVEPVAPSEKALAHEPVSLENLWWIHYNLISNIDNLKLLDESTAMAEAYRFKLAGGQTIVDASSYGRDPNGLARLARATGLNIIMGSGYYRAGTHQPDLEDMGEEEIAQSIIRDFTHGVDGTGIRPGIVGEIGCSWPWLESEKKVLRAAVIVQRETGAPLSIHPGNDQGAPMEIADELMKAGADFSRTIMCHVDVRILEMERMLELAQTGLYLEYDLFGIETHCTPRVFLDIPNDAQRIGQLATLIDKGYLERILISQDICTKNRLTRYGGHGYDHLMRNILPRMRAKGFTEEQLRTILVENPKRLLRFA